MYVKLQSNKRALAGKQLLAKQIHLQKVSSGKNRLEVETRTAYFVMQKTYCLLYGQSFVF